MKRYGRVAGAACGSNFSFLPYAQACAQDKLSFAAGTPEDHDLQAISERARCGKKLAMYQDFVPEVFVQPRRRGLWRLANFAGLPEHS